MSRPTCTTARTTPRTTPRRTALRLISLAVLALPLLAVPLLATPGASSTGLARSATVPAAACRAPVVGPSRSEASNEQPRLDDVRVGRHDDAGYDRVVLDLSDIPGYRVHRVRRVVQDGSGRTLQLRGRSFLVVRLEPAVAHDDRGRPTSPRRIRRAFPQLREVRRVGDFEGVVTYGLGLRRTTDFQVSTVASPARLVIDVAHPRQHPFECRAGAVQAVFATADATPATVLRRVPTSAVARGALTALYAGPTDFDRPAGLSFVASESSGFTRLRVRNGIARVRLTGGCDSGGATFTVANEIMPTLKQFTRVDVVKIYDPRGETERPRGRSDSIPTCLEP